MKDKQEEQLKKDKHIVASNIHIMENYLGIKRKMSYKKAMSKTLEQLEKQYADLVPKYQKLVKTHWIEYQLANEFDMDDYETGDFDFDDDVDKRREQLDRQQGYIYLGVFWYVIYTLDTRVNQYELQEYGKREAETTIKAEKPNCVKPPTWYLTETEVEEPEWYYAHRKWCADELTTEQLVEFCREVDFGETNNTLGALTIEHGLIPAVSFNDRDNQEADHNAYISPLMIDDQLNQLYVKYSKDNWESEEAKDMQRIVGNAIDELMQILSDSPDNDFKNIPKAVRISAPMTLPLKQVEEKNETTL